MDLAQFEDRHPRIKSVLQFFGSSHLHAELRDIVDGCGNLAEAAALMISDHPQLEEGLQRLLDAKDAFVRALADQKGIISGQQPATPPAPVDPAPVVPEPAPVPQPPVQAAPEPTPEPVAAAPAPSAMDPIAPPPPTIPDSGGAGTIITLTPGADMPITHNAEDAPPAAAPMPGADLPITHNAEPDGQ